MKAHQIIIEPVKGWRFIDWREISEYRDLLFFWAWRSIKIRYAQSVIGVGWALIQPICSMVVFTVVFGKMARIDSDGMPYSIFSLAGIVPWTYFSNALQASTVSLMNNTHLITKVYFPRLILPVSEAFAKLLDFSIAMVILLAWMVWFRVVPDAGVSVLPLLILLMTISAAGLGIWLASLAVQYRDVGHAMIFFIQLLMFASPVVYPVSLVPETYRVLYALNPMAGVIEGFRSALLAKNPMPWDMIAEGFAVSIVMALLGTFYFRRRERIFADVA